MDLLSKLRDRYRPPAWSVAFEVANGTGAAARRRCDCLAMSVWPSNGLHLHGHEIKVSRSDWLKEIQDVGKAGAFRTYCHFWWIVAPKGLVKLEELPATWGLLHATDKSDLRVARPATHQPDAQLDWKMFASCLRAFQSQIESDSRLQSEYHRGYEAGKQVGESALRRSEQSSQKVTEHLTRCIDHFQKRSGICITGYNGDQIAGAVFRLANRQFSDLVSQLKNAAETIRDLQGEVDGILKAADVLETHAAVHTDSVGAGSQMEL